MSADNNAFRLISVHDDEEELVIHAGSGKGAAISPEAEVAPNSDASPAAAESAAAEPADAPAPAAAAPSARQEKLRRKAEELAQAEEGLEDPHAFARTRIYVLVALALLIVAFAVYTFVLHQ